MVIFMILPIFRTLIPPSTKVGFGSLKTVLMSSDDVTFVQKVVVESAERDAVGLVFLSLSTQLTNFFACSKSRTRGKNSPLQNACFTFILNSTL